MVGKRAPLTSEYPPYAPQGPYGCFLLAFAVASALVGWIAGTMILAVGGQFDPESGDTLSWIAVPVIAIGVGWLAVSLLVTSAARLPAALGRPWLENVGVYLAALLLPGCLALAILFVMPESWATPAAALVVGAWVIAWFTVPSARRWWRRRRPERPPVAGWTDPFERYDFVFDLPQGWVAGDPATIRDNLKAFLLDRPDLAPTVDRVLERGLDDQFAILVTGVDGDPPTISFSRHPIAWYPDRDLAAWVSSYALSLEARREGEPSELRGGKVRSSLTTLAFGPATLLSWEHVPSVTAHRNYWFDQGTWRQSLHLSCGEATVEAIEPSFEQIVGSFRARNQDGADPGRS